MLINYQGTWICERVNESRGQGRAQVHVLVVKAEVMGEKTGRFAAEGCREKRKENEGDGALAVLIDAMDALAAIAARRQRFPKVRKKRRMTRNPGRQAASISGI